MLLSLAALFLAGCGPTYWTNITGKRLAPSVASSIRSIVSDPTRDILYAATSGQGVWRCTAPGTNPTWTHMVGGAPLDYVTSVLYEPSHNDQGGTWTNTDKNFSASQSIGSAGPLAYDPTRDILCMSNEKEILRCTRAENAPSWERMGGAVNSYTIGSVAYDQASNILYAGAYIPSAETEPFPINAERSSPAPRVNTHSTGVWACSNPDTSPIMTNTGGAVSSKDIGDLYFDPAQRVLYVVAGQKAVWRYKPPANR